MSELRHLARAWYRTNANIQDPDDPTVGTLSASIPAHVLENALAVTWDDERKEVEVTFWRSGGSHV